MTSAEAVPGVRAAWPPRRIVAAVVAGVVFALAVGIPTGIVPTPLYSRMTPVLWWNYPVWGATAVLGGLVVATYIRRPGDAAPRNGLTSASGGGLLAAFAVGCPVCNKLIVSLIGVSGALEIWAPLQPVMGVLSVLGLGWALRRRITNEYACSVTRATRSSDRARSDGDSPTLDLSRLALGQASIVAEQRTPQ